MKMRLEGITARYARAVRDGDLRILAQITHEEVPWLLTQLADKEEVVPNPVTVGEVAAIIGNTVARCGWSFTAIATAVLENLEERIEVLATVQFDAWIKKYEEQAPAFQRGVEKALCDKITLLEELLRKVPRQDGSDGTNDGDHADTCYRWVETEEGFSVMDNSQSCTCHVEPIREELGEK